MSKVSIPTPPQASWESKPEKTAVEKPLAASVSQRLDAAFLCRLYRSVTVFAVAATLFALFATWQQGANAAQRWTFWFGIGAALGVGLLRSQGWIIGRALQLQETKAKGIDKRLLFWLIVPVKYLLVMIGLGWAIKFGDLHLFAFGAGFFAVQMAILAKITGWVLAQHVRTVRETFIS